MRRVRRHMPPFGTSAFSEGWTEENAEAFIKAQVGVMGRPEDEDSVVVTADNSCFVALGALPETNRCTAVDPDSAHCNATSVF